MGDSNQIDRFVKQMVEGTARNAIEERAMLQHGQRAALPILTPYVIIDTVFDPTIVDDAKITYWRNELGISNIEFATVLPRNTIIAQRVRDGTSGPADAPMFLFPLFAELALPCNPGEHVWVIFPHRDLKKMDLGYWICRIVTLGFVEDANHVHAPRVHDPSFIVGTKDLSEGTSTPVYEFRPGRVAVIKDERFTDPETMTMVSDDERIYEKLMTASDAGKLCHYEPVPRFRKRPGDIVIEGRNNAVIVLGRHRTGAVAEYTLDEGMGKMPSLPINDSPNDGAAMIDIIAGRGMTTTTAGNTASNSLNFKELDKVSNKLVEAEGDPDFSADAARITISQQMPVDANFGLATVNSEFGSGVFQGDGTPAQQGISDLSESGNSAIVVKADKIRLIARSDIELIVSSYELNDAGVMEEVTDPTRCAALVIKANGDIVLRPATKGYIKLGGDDADKAIVCTDQPATPTNGNVIAPPLQTTMGGFFSNTNIPGQGVYASKILVTGPTTAKR